MADRYCIKDGYQHRTDPVFFDDTPFKDEFQDSVYSHARLLADFFGFNSVLDVGTGSGYKLLKYFRGKHTLGIDLPRTVAWLREAYPERQWKTFGPPALGYQLLICSDVIEHLQNPDGLLNWIEVAAPNLIVLSTPDRSLMAGHLQDGPPHNLSHVREWSFEEFRAYIGRRFDVATHEISNREQMTQMMVCRLK